MRQQDAALIFTFVSISVPLLIVAVVVMVARQTRRPAPAFRYKIAGVGVALIVLIAAVVVGVRELRAPHQQAGELAKAASIDPGADAAQLPRSIEQAEGSAGSDTPTRAWGIVPGHVALVAVHAEQRGIYVRSVYVREGSRATECNNGWPACVRLVRDAAGRWMLSNAHTNRQRANTRALQRVRTLLRSV